jgi:hypothetical protein
MIFVTAGQGPAPLGDGAGSSCARTAATVDVGGPPYGCVVAETLVLPVPDLLTASFVVVDPRKALPSHIAQRARFEPVPADHPSMPRPSTLVDGGVSFPILSRLTGEPHLLVSMTGPPGWPPEHLFDASAEAGALAIMTEGLMLDPLLARLVSTDGPERAQDVPEDFFVPQWVRVMGSAERSGLLMTTRGLSRLGLPELRTTGLPPYLGLAWARVLTVVAFRLLQDLWQDLDRDAGLRSREISEEFTIEPYDLALALSQDPRDSYEVAARLRFGDEHLTLLPPRDYDGPVARWFREATILLFPTARI